MKCPQELLKAFRMLTPPGWKSQVARCRKLLDTIMRATWDVSIGCLLQNCLRKKFLFSKDCACHFNEFEWLSWIGLRRRFMQKFCSPTAPRHIWSWLTNFLLLAPDDGARTFTEEEKKLPVSSMLDLVFIVKLVSVFCSHEVLTSLPRNAIEEFVCQWKKEKIRSKCLAWFFESFSRTATSSSWGWSVSSTATSSWWTGSRRLDGRRQRCHW